MYYSLEKKHGEDQLVLNIDNAISLELSVGGVDEPSRIMIYMAMILNAKSNADSLFAYKNLVEMFKDTECDVVSDEMTKYHMSSDRTISINILKKVDALMKTYNIANENWQETDSWKYWEAHRMAIADLLFAIYTEVEKERESEVYE
jgi:hypothetical protein